MINWNGKQVVVIGAARQGTALSRFLCNHGAKVILTDHRSFDLLHSARKSLADLPIEWICGEHPISMLDGTDLVCLSGGVPLDLPMVVEARSRNIPISNDSQIFLEVVPCRVIGITGSAGKTTTTTLVGRIANESWKETGKIGKVYVGGNIGDPLINYVDEMRPEDLAVVEFSSFQLEIMTKSPEIAAVLNITPNHLDRHNSMDAYTEAKSHLLSYQGSGDVAVLNYEDPGAWSLNQFVRGKLVIFGMEDDSKKCEGVFTKHDQVILVRPQSEEVVLTLSEIGLRGQHNLQNVLAACAISSTAGFSISAMRKGIIGFRGVKHRLQFVRSWGGADWYNDSIATAPERALAALRSFDEPIILLAGGRDKNLPWCDFVKFIIQRVDHLILFGEAASLISDEIKSVSMELEPRPQSIDFCPGLFQAVQVAANVVQPGDVVLFSPGGTSFDEFIDFEERGKCFETWVNQLP